MNHITCIIQNDRVEIFRGRRMIGTVVAIGEGEPAITLFPDIYGGSHGQCENITLTFNDIAIIQDNWNQCEEIVKKRLTSPENAIR